MARKSTSKKGRNKKYECPSCGKTSGAKDECCGELMKEQ